MVQWPPQFFPTRIAYAAVSPAATAVPHATATSSAQPTATSPTATATAKPTATTPPAAAIAIQNLAFSPAAITVSQGATVTWTNDDSVPHTSTSDTSGLWDSGAIAGNGGAFSFTFNLAPGVYNYHCAIHSFMKGSVTVI